jgi:hypothetical protein
MRWMRGRHVTSFHPSPDGQTRRTIEATGSRVTVVEQRIAPMLTSKSAWLATAVFATAAVCGVAPAFAAVAPADMVSVSQTPANPAPTYHVSRPRYWGVGPDGLMKNGLLPPSPSVG